MNVQQLLFEHLWDQLPPSSPSTSSSSSSLFSSQTPTTTANSQHSRPRPTPPPASPIMIYSAIATTTAAAAAVSAELVDSPNPKSLETIKCTSRNLHAAASLQMQMQSAGGTRWSPMPQQIKELEALYNGGMRTPNPVQIERITAELGKYGRIEGKNVFYWFQNHKARERQKQKRGALLPLASNSSFSHYHHLKREEMEELLHGASCKRKCRRWSCVELEVGEGEDIHGDRTLELFPLQPEYWKQQM